MPAYCKQYSTPRELRAAGRLALLNLTSRSSCIATTTSLPCSRHTDPLWDEPIPRTHGFSFSELFFSMLRMPARSLRTAKLLEKTLLHEPCHHFRCSRSAFSHEAL